MRAQGMTYAKIHEIVTQKGYSGTVASLRVFMQKERTHMRTISTHDNNNEYIPRKCLCQLIYRKLENVKSLTQEQYEATLREYPILGQLYELLKEFHRIMFSHKSSELDSWIEKASKLKVPALDSYISGLQNDIVAVKNGIDLQYNNGLAEGSVNKIKLIKRTMYGRNSFELLRAKLLLNELFSTIFN